MPRKDYRTLQAELAEANDYIAELETKLDDIAGIVSDEEDEQGEAEEKGTDEEDGSDEGDSEVEEDLDADGVTLIEQD